MAYDSTTTDAPAKTGKGANQKALLEKIKKYYKFASEAWKDQRERTREDVRFQLAEHQWTALAKEQRAGRPMLSVSLLNQPMALVRNQAANARLGVNLNPVNEDATDDLAEVKQGLYRRIERDGN